MATCASICWTSDRSSAATDTTGTSTLYPPRFAQPQPTDGGFGSFFSILPARKLSPTFPIFPTPASSYHRRMASLSVASLFHPRESVHERRAQGGENGASKDSGRESHTTRC